MMASNNINLPTTKKRLRQDTALVFSFLKNEESFIDISNPKIYPGIKIYQNHDITDSSAITLPGFGIYIGGGNRGDALKMLMQHEYGHYLDYYNIGFIKFYGRIGIPSLWNAATGIGGNHRYYWTEIRANKLAKEWFGKDLHPDFFDYFPIN